MKKAAICIPVLALFAAPLTGASRAAVTGDYVEVRTAEVFTGGCIMGSEGEAAGRQAILAWRVASGSVAGVPLDGLAVVAAVAADTNLGFHEHGGAAPGDVKAVVMVDERATPAQQDALVALAGRMANGLIGNVVDRRSVPISFVRDGEEISVAAGDARLSVGRLEHDMSCGAMQWFQPLSDVEHAVLGVTHVQAYSGGSLGTRWQQVDRKSAFFGTFSF